MYLEITPEAEQTKRFLNYLAEYLISKRPFEVDKIIDIPILENSEKFPHISEIVKENSHRRIGHQIKVGVNRTMVFSFPKKGQSTTEEIMDISRRKSRRKDAVGQYVLVLFLDALIYRAEMVDANNPSGHLLSFQIKDVVKLEDKISEIGAGNLKQNYPIAILKTNPLRICFKDKEIEIEEGTIQSRVCEIMMGKPLNAMVEMADLVDEACGTGIEDTKTKWKSMYNALSIINRAVEVETGEKIFKTGKIRLSKIK